MRPSLRTGFSFGSTSGIITTLGLMVGLHASTHSRAVVIGGILTIAVADAFSDALGIHVSQESQDKLSRRHIWEATLAAFLSKFIIALTFILPVIYFGLLQAIIISVLWGLSLLSVLSYLIARKRQPDPWKVVLEHLVIALLVIVITRFIGDWIADVFV